MDCIDLTCVYFSWGSCQIIEVSYSYAHTVALMQMSNSGLRREQFRKDFQLYTQDQHKSKSVHPPVNVEMFFSLYSEYFSKSTLLIVTILFIFRRLKSLSGISKWTVSAAMIAVFLLYIHCVFTVCTTAAVTKKFLLGGESSTPSQRAHIVQKRPAEYCSILYIYIFFLLCKNW